MSSIRVTFRIVHVPIIALSFFAGSLPAAAQEPVYYTMLKGEMADYGATPWFTEDILVGKSIMNFTLDTGTTLLWATSDECITAACEPHHKVNSTQPGFVWLEQPDPPIEVNFGPWGVMDVWIAEAPFVGPEPAPSLNLTFDASVSYTGPKFQYLTWDGGIGFPSESQSVMRNDFYFEAFVEATGLPAVFSTYTADATGRGAFVLGGVDLAMIDPTSEVVLEPLKSPVEFDLWGTPLAQFSVGLTQLPELSGQVFFVDSGSSRFKGDQTYIYPILNELLTYTDDVGSPIFEKYYEDLDGVNAWTGLQYVTGGPTDHPNLPSFTLELGRSCGGDENSHLSIQLSPEQYSYYVDVGDRTGQWVAAVHVLDGVGGLLVGATFMDLVHVTFNYETSIPGVLSQGNMSLHRKTEGLQPQSYLCVMDG